jgi:N-methylhydantoinase B
VWEQDCGGGYGDPFERDAEAVLHDWREELISAESAERDYGVVIDTAADAVDAGATARRRAQARG